jgi:hypothetical protein
LLEKPEGKRTEERPKRRWEYYIQMDTGEIGWCGMCWIDLAQDRDECRAANLRVPQKADQF